MRQAHATTHAPNRGFNMAAAGALRPFGASAPVDWFVERPLLWLATGSDGSTQNLHTTEKPGLPGFSVCCTRTTATIL